MKKAAIILVILTFSSCRMIKHSNEYFNHDLSLLRYNKVSATPPISTINTKSLHYEKGGKNIIYDVNDFKLDSLDRVANEGILNFFFRRDVLFMFDEYAQNGCCEYCDSIEYSTWKLNKELYIVGFEQKSSKLQSYYIILHEQYFEEHSPFYNSELFLVNIYDNEQTNIIQLSEYFSTSGHVKKIITKKSNNKYVIKSSLSIDGWVENRNFHYYIIDERGDVNVNL